MGYKGFLNQDFLDVFYPNVLKSVDFSFFFYESIRVHKKLGGEAQNSKNG